MLNKLVSCQRKWTPSFKDVHLFEPLVWNTAWKLSAVYGSFLSCVQSHQHEHSGRKRCVGSRARIESYSSLLSSFVANVFPHKLADNNPDSQNNLCKPTQWQCNLNLHKRALMGCVSGDRSIARQQGLSVSLAVISGRANCCFIDGEPSGKDAACWSTK